MAAAGSAGDTAPNRAGLPDAGGFDASADAETTRATMESMMDSITRLQTQLAALSEDHDIFIQRCPDATFGESGPAVRELRYTRGMEYDRNRMTRIEEQLNTHNLRMNDIESSQGYFTSELTTVNETLGNMNTAITTLRSPVGTVTGPSGRRELLTGT